MARTKGYSTKQVGALTIRTYRRGGLCRPCDGGCLADKRGTLRKEAVAELEVASWHLARLCQSCTTLWARTWREATQERAPCPALAEAVSS